MTAFWDQVDDLLTSATGLVCTLDPHKRDSEVTCLWRCSHQDIEAMCRFYAEQPMRVLIVERDR